MATKKVTKAASKEMEFVVKASDANQVILTGDFTNWSDAGVPLEKAPGGEWHATLSLPPGEYQYRIRVDGQWRDHPAAQKRVPNPFGSENCVLVVN